MNVCTCTATHCQRNHGRVLVRRLRAKLVEARREVLRLELALDAATGVA